MSPVNDREKVRPRRGARRLPLYLGVLEDRCLPATITVTSLADNLTADGQVTLREAIQAANTNTSVDGSTAGAAGADTIVFASGVAGTLSLALGELTITESLGILGWGPTGLVIDAAHNSRLFTVTETGGDVSLVGLSLINGRVSSGTWLNEVGGAVRFLSTGALNLVNCTVTGNQAGRGGGGIFSYGSVAVTGSTISGNTATRLGGGIYSIPHSTAALTVTDSTIADNATTGSDGAGGGIFSVGAYVTLVRSTVSGNTAGQRGGGLDTDQPLNVINSTVSGNRASIYGGGIVAFRGAVTLTNSTVTLNETAGDGGGLIVGVATTSLTLRSSIVAGNRDIGDGSHPDLRLVAGPTVGLTNSLVGNSAGTSLTATGPTTPDANGNLIGSAAAPIDPRLGPLAANGGPTRTHALFADSPAVDHGANPTDLTTDQRGTGFDRVVGGQADMGAFEFRAPLVVTDQCYP